MLRTRQRQPSTTSPMLELLSRQAKNAALPGASRRVPTSMYSLAMSVVSGPRGLNGATH